MQSWPKWAQRHIVLGLDLQGGSHILLEVDAAAVRKEKVERCATTCAACCATPASAAPAPRWCAATASRCAIREGGDLQQALTKLRELSQPLGGLLGATGQRSVDIVERGGGLIRLTPTEPAIVERIRQSVEQSIQIIERRVNELGTVEPLDPAPGRRPHPGAGAGPAGSARA